MDICMHMMHMFVATRRLVQARVGKSDISVRRHYPVTFHRSRLCVSSQPPNGSSRVNSPTIKQAAVKGNSHICDLPDGGSLPLPIRFGYLPSLSSSKASVITLFLRPGREMDSLGLWALAFGSSGPVTST